MGWLNREELKTLIRTDATPCVSAYLPTHEAGPDVRQDPIRLKNAVAEARRALTDRGLAEDDVDALLAPWEALGPDEDFWRFQSRGLALFAAPGVDRRYRVPVQVPERTIVGDRFHVKPLVPLLADGRFFILGLSRGRVRLLEATLHDVREMDLEDVPEELRDAVGYDFEERSLQFHTAAPRGAGGDHDTRFHGQGRSEDADHAELLHFVELVEKGVRAMLAGHDEPLVVAAVDEVFGEYRKRSRYAALVEDHVRGNPDEVDAATLHARALEVVSPRFDEARGAAAARFRQLHGTGRASADLRVVVLGACDGRVESLLVERGAARWGRVDPEGREVDELAEGEGEDLLDRAAAETVLHDGRVWLVEADDMPADGAEVAAVFRY